MTSQLERVNNTIADYDARIAEATSRRDDLQGTADDLKEQQYQAKRAAMAVLGEDRDALLLKSRQFRDESLDWANQAAQVQFEINELEKQQRPYIEKATAIRRRSARPLVESQRDEIVREFQPELNRLLALHAIHCGVSASMVTGAETLGKLLQTGLERRHLVQDVDDEIIAIRDRTGLS